MQTKQMHDQTNLNIFTQTERDRLRERLTNALRVRC